MTHRGIPDDVVTFLIDRIDSVEQLEVLLLLQQTPETVLSMEKLLDLAPEEKDLLSKIEEMSESDRKLAMRIHEIMKDAAPELFPKTWYGMPAYARDGKVICFFQAASKFGVRYSTFGFQEDANLDDGNMWPISFALTKLTSAEEAKIREMVKQALS